jgi:hypothetical protein
MGNHTQIAQHFRLVKYYNLHIYVYTYVHMGGSQVMGDPQVMMVGLSYDLDDLGVPLFRKHSYN